MDHDELVGWLRERLDDKPLPRLREELIHEGHSSAVVDAAIDALFQGDSAARRRRLLRGGLIGAVIGAAAWAAAYFLLRR